MSFNATPEVTESAYGKIRMQAADSKNYLQTQRAKMVQATCSATVPFDVIQHFSVVIPRLNTWSATPGLAQYAKDQQNDPTYDVIAEFTTMRNAMNSALSGLVSLVPTSATFALLFTINADGTLTWRTFTQAQLASAVSLIDSVIAAIN